MNKGIEAERNKVACLREGTCAEEKVMMGIHFCPVPTSIQEDRQWWTVTEARSEGAQSQMLWQKTQVQAAGRSFGSEV